MKKSRYGGFGLFLLICIILALSILNISEVEATENEKTIEEGTYIIRSAIDENYVLDIAGASKFDKGNLQIWANSNVAQQRFTLKYLSDGEYTITNVNSNKVLDVEDGSKKSGANIQQYSSNGTDAQKWKIKDEGNGYFSIISKLSGLSIDVDGGITNNGTNIQLYTNNSTNSQKFKFEKYGETAITGNTTIISSNKTIEDGTYTIKSAINDKFVLDISGASIEDKGNLQVWTDSNVDQQFFTVKYLSEGYYTITNVNSNKVLDVENGDKSPGTNVQQYSSNETDAQKWIIKDAGNGYYQIISKLSGLCLDISEGKVYNGANVQIYTSNSTNSQKFKFENKTNNETIENVNKENNEEQNNSTSIETEEKPVITGNKTLNDGTYIIKSGANPNYVLDISNNSQNDRGNVQIWSNASVIQQRFNLKYLDNGCYKIECAGSKKVLDVENEKKESGTNVQQYSSKDILGQQWVLEDAGNGYFYIISAASGLYLDVSYGEAKDGANIQIYTGNKSFAQKFIIELAGLKTVENGIYNIKSSINNTFVLDVAGGSSSNGANIQLWENVGERQQKFRITYNNDGSYKITSCRSKKALDVTGGSKTSGTNVQQYEFNNTNSQKWIIEKNGNDYSFISKLSGLCLDVEGAIANNTSNIQVYTENHTKAQIFNLEKTTDSISIDKSRYPGYKEKIESLMDNHPNWDFELLYVGRSLSWDVDREADLITRNLVPNTYSSEWVLNYSSQDTGSWVPASKYAIRYYMDPRNFLNDVDVFQFKDVNQYNEDACTEGGIWNRVSGSYLNDYVNDIINACRNKGVDPYYVIARLIQEQGWGGGSTWRMGGDRGTVYNPFNIGASGNSRSEVNWNAYNRAANSGWYSMESAIEGGINFLKMNYLENYQNTLYTNKFDIDPRKSSNYNHQYMQNTLAAYNEARNLRSFYNADGKIDSNFRFIIPVYEGL